MPVKKSQPPPRRTGRSGGRKMDPQTIAAMRVVANHPDEWFQIAEYKSTGSASSAANRLRARDWEQELGYDGKGDEHSWDIVSRTFEEDGKGAGVWAIRRKLAHDTG